MPQKKITTILDINFLKKLVLYLDRNANDFIEEGDKIYS